MCGIVYKSRIQGRTSLRITERSHDISYSYWSDPVSISTAVLMGVRYNMPTYHNKFLILNVSAINMVVEFPPKRRDMPAGLRDVTATSKSQTKSLLSSTARTKSVLSSVGKALQPFLSI
jgi:hypothetical protein